MRVKTILIDPDAVDPNGLAEAQAVAGAAALTLDGVLISGGIYTGDYARQIGILSAADDSLITFTIVGTDANGKAISEAVTGSAAAPGTAESALYFLTVTSITSSGAAAGNVSAGTVDELVTNTIPLDRINGDGATVSVEDITGTMDYTVQETFSDIQNATTFEWYDASDLTGRTAAGRAELTIHASGIRFKLNSYTSGADAKMVINQNRAR